jgi:CBS domain-containing protein
MKAVDVMVSDVIAVGPGATLPDVADLLVTHRISALPVVGPGGELVGIVSDGDLIRRSATDIERRPSCWLALVFGAEPPAERLKLRTLAVADVMTRDVIVASPDTPLRDIAALLEKSAIKRVPIVKGGKLVGIITRANLVQALATARKEIKAATATSDLMIREDVTSRLQVRSGANRSRINIVVHDGTVELWGLVSSGTEKDVIRTLAELTPGVRAVSDHLVVKPGPSSLQAFSAHIP